MKDKRAFFLFLLLFTFVLIVTFTLRGNYYKGDYVEIFGLAVKLNGAIQWLSIFYLILLFISFILLVKSLKKNKVLAVIVASICFVLGPSFLEHQYQKTFATGIQAVHYDYTNSSCSFEKLTGKKMHIQCSLVMSNYNDRPITVPIIIDISSDESDFMALNNLLDRNGPYEIEIKPQKDQRIEFETILDISNTRIDIDNGTVYRMPIRIVDGGKEIEL